MGRFPALLIAAGLLSIAAAAAQADEQPAVEQPAVVQPSVVQSVVQPLFRPLALAATRDPARIVVAGGRGKVALVDVETSQVVAELQIADSLTDLVPLDISGDTLTYLATDDSAHRLLLITLRDHSFNVTASLPIAPYPVSVQVTRDGRLASVASLWSRRLTLVQISSADEKLAVQLVIDLPFAPKRQIILPDQSQAMVFDNFGGRFATVELATGKITIQREFPGHAVRGLAFTPDAAMLLASHQMLNADAHVNQSDIHWGLVMSNDLRWMRLDSLLDPEREIYAGGRVHPLGMPGHGGADPTGVAMTRAGTVIVCLGGVNEVMIGTHEDLSLRPLRVGRRPTAVQLLGDQSRAVVANTFDDTLSIVDLAEHRVRATIALPTSPQHTLLQQGEELFYDARFSHEGWMSCHSCHTDGHSNFARNDNLSDGGFGAPKLVLSLLGRKDTSPFAWNASVATLAEQIHNSVHKTMQSDRSAIPESEVAALVAYVESLPAPPSIAALRGTADAAAIERGGALFAKAECIKCHAPPRYTTPALEQVAIRDELGKSRFNPPSLLGVGQRDALLHDGRAKSIDEVLTFVGHPQEQQWSSEELADLVAFLKSL